MINELGIGIGRKFGAPNDKQPGSYYSLGINSSNPFSSTTWIKFPTPNYPSVYIEQTSTPAPSYITLLLAMNYNNDYNAFYVALKYIDGITPVFRYYSGTSWTIYTPPSGAPPITSNVSYADTIYSFDMETTLNTLSRYWSIQIAFGTTGVGQYPRCYDFYGYTI